VILLSFSNLVINMPWRQNFRKFRLKIDSYFRRNSYDGMTKLLISTNIGVFLAWQVLDPRFMYKHFIMNEINTIRQKKYYTIFTSSFSHTSAMHLFFNMVGLWFFGRHIEMILGPLGLLNLYLTGSLFGYLGVWWEYKRKYWGRPIPNHLGASGATSAIFSYFICGNPWEPVLFFFVPMPAVVAGLIIFFLGSGGYEGRVSHVGHLGGALGGAIFYFLRRGLF